MGVIFEFENTNLIVNGLFPKTWPWAPVPPWVISSGRAHWNFFGSTLGNDLTQTTYAGADETYQCSFRAEVFVAQRGFNFGLADVTAIFFLNPGVHEVSFELTPTVPGDFVLHLAQAAGPGGTADIWDIQVWGLPVGNPMYDMLFENGFAPLLEAYTEYWNLGGGEEWFNIAGWADASHCLIKKET